MAKAGLDLDGVEALPVYRPASPDGRRPVNGEANAPAAAASERDDRNHPQAALDERPAAPRGRNGDSAARNGATTEAGAPAEVRSSVLEAPAFRPEEPEGGQGADGAWDPFITDPEPEPARPSRLAEAVEGLGALRDRLRRRPEPEPPAAPGPSDRAGRSDKLTTTAERQQQQTLGQWFREIVILGLIAILTAVLLTNYVVQAFYIPSESMENTLLINDRVLVNKMVYRFRDPRPGEIVVFTSPERIESEVETSGPLGEVLNEAAQGLGLRSSVQDLIKRVVAVEGQTVEVRIGALFVDGQQMDEPFRKDLLPMDDFGPVTVPEGHVFVMGDNRNFSRDSRVFGAVPESTIVGRAFALIWPVERFTWFR